MSDNTAIPLSIPKIGGKDWDYIKDCLDGGWVSSKGKYVNEFEKKIAEYVGVKYTIACVNGTAALHISLILAGVGKDDEVIVPTVTFIAPVNAVRYVGGEPVFMDCDDFYNIDIVKTREFIEKETVFKDGYTYNKKTGRRIVAVIAVHVFGNAAWLEPLLPICREKNIKVIEDAAESLGTHYSTGELAGQYTGAVGDIGCYSFNGNKIITAAGGGMIVTNNHEYAEKARYLTTQAKNDAVQYIHNEVGYNYRLTNIQAAMGVAQLEHLTEYIDTKKKNYRIYKTAIEEISGLHLTNVPEYACNNYWMYALQVDEEEYGKGKNQLMAWLAENGVQVRPLWYLNHIQKPYKACQTYKIEKAYSMWEKTLNIPCSANLSIDNLNYVVATLKQ